MTKQICALFAALALVLTLAACGSSKDAPNSGADGNNGNTGTDSGITGDAGTRQDDPLLPNGQDSVTPGVLPDQTPSGLEDGQQTGVSLDQMLKNGRVRDRDGDLLDGENAVSPGAAAW